MHYFYLFLFETLIFVYKKFKNTMDGQSRWGNKLYTTRWREDNKQIQRKICKIHIKLLL